MTTLLQINASINNDNSQSSRLANQFVQAFRDSHPGAQILLRQVAANEPVPHLDGERFSAFITPPEARNAAQHAVVAYSDKGAVGLLTGKKAYVFAARGGQYVGTPLDTQTGYVRDFLRFVGIGDVEFVYAEGLNLSPQSKEAGLAKAAAEIARLAA